MANRKGKQKAMTVTESVTDSVTVTATGIEIKPVTRSAKVWHNSKGKGRENVRNLVMSLPADVAEIAGYRAGDAVLVTGTVEGRITVVKADKEISQ
jgi:hypothetical protein